MGPFHKPKNSSKSIRSSNNMPVKLEKETSNENLGKQQSLDLFTLEDFQITPLLKYEKPIHSPGHILCQARTSTPKDLLFASESASSLICRDSPTFQNGQSKFRKSTNRALDPGIQNINSQDDEFKFAHSQCHTKQTKFLNETYVEADEREKEINQTRYGLMNERHLKKTEKYRYKLDRDFQFSSPYVLDKGMTWGETEKTFQESYIRRESDSKMFAKTSEQVQISHHNIAISESPMYVLDSQGVCVSDSLHSTQNSLLLDEKNSANINALETSKHKLFNMKTEHIKNIWTKKSTRKKPVQEIYVPENMRTPQMECKFFKGTQILDLEVHGDEHNGKENCEDHIKNTEEIDEVFHIFQYPIFPALEENAEDDKERRSSSPKPAKEFPQSLAIDHDDMIAASTMSYMSEFWEKNKSAVYNPNHHSAKKPKLELWCSPTVTGPDVENKESSLTQERHLKQIGDVVQEVCQLDDQDMCDNMFSQDTDTANQDADLDEADIFIISLGYDQVENVPLPEDRNASADKTPEPKNPPSSATKSRSCEDLSTTEVHEDIQIKENAGKTDRMAGFASQVHSSCENSVYLDKNRGDIDKEVVEMHPRNIFNQYEISDEHIKLQTTEVNQDSSQNQSSYEKLDEKVNSQISKTDIKELHKSAKPEQLDDIAESVVSCANQNAFHQNYMGSENEVLNKTCIMFTTVSCSKTDDSTFCDDLSRPNLIRDKASLDFTKDATLYDGVLAQHDLVNEMNDQSKKSYTDMATSPIVTEKISRSAQSSPDLTDKYSDNPIIPRLEVLTQKTLSLKPISYYYRQLAMKEIKHVSCQTEILNPKHFELTSNEM
ncbi:hypothetical protein ACJMK2_016569 [Sinanodonta woodiana]|uniref:Uncharacterized protein n=1 Tax=Sinanodonta woodiana TaxID=1069815 RepID=A0ABD3UU02_SINWO